MQSEAIRGNQRQSEARRSNQRQSEAIRSNHRMQSDSIRGNHRQSETLRSNQRQSEAITGNQKPSEAIRGNQRQSETVIGNQMQSKATISTQRQSKAIRGNHRRQSSQAIIRGSHRPTSADFGQRLVGRRPVVGQRLGGVEDHHTPSREARLTLVHRVRARVHGAVVSVWVAPSWAYRWRRLRRLDARVGAHLWGRGRERRGGHLHARLGARRGSPRTCCAGRSPPKDATFPFRG